MALVKELRTNWTADAKKTILAARVRINDGRVGTVVQIDGPALFTVLIAGKEVLCHSTAIKEVGQDVKFRCAKQVREIGAKFVPMSSLCS